MYVPPGAGGNFIGLHALWCGSENLHSQLDGVHFIEKTATNEFKIPRQHSTLWDLHNQKSSDHELMFVSMYPELKKYHEVWNTFFEFSSGEISRFSLSHFFQLLREAEISISAYEVLTRNFFWLPIFDYSMFYSMIGGKSEKLDDYCKHLMDMCWEIHKKENKDLRSIAHYHPGLDFKDYDYSTDIDTLCLSISGCEDYITDLMEIKSGSQDQNHPNELPDGIRHAINDNKYDQQKSEIVVEYKKVFFKNDGDEIRKLYKFFGNEEYFDKNTNDITTAFGQYHKDNQKTLHDFCWNRLLNSGE